MFISPPNCFFGGEKIFLKYFKIFIDIFKYLLYNAKTIIMELYVLAYFQDGENTGEKGRKSL